MTKKIIPPKATDREIADMFDEWRNGLSEENRVKIDEWIDKLCEKVRNMGPQSAKVILAHTISIVGRGL